MLNQSQAVCLRHVAWVVTVALVLATVPTLHITTLRAQNRSEDRQLENNSREINAGMDVGSAAVRLDHDEHRSERDRHIDGMILLRGTDAIRRAAAVRPAWGDSVRGVQIGVATSNVKRQVATDGKLDLEFYIRNVSSDTVRIQIHIWGWPFDFERNVPIVVDAEGNGVTVTGQSAWPAGMCSDEILRPDEVIIVAHPGLWFSIVPNRLTTLSLETGLPRDQVGGYPFIAAIARGKFKLVQSATITQLAVNDSDDPQGLELSTGEFEFHVVDTPSRQHE